eukprot:UN25872
MIHTRSWRQVESIKSKSNTERSEEHLKLIRELASCLDIKYLMLEVEKDTWGYSLQGIDRDMDEEGTNICCLIIFMQAYHQDNWDMRPPREMYETTCVKLLNKMIEHKFFDELHYIKSVLMSFCTENMLKN